MTLDILIHSAILMTMTGRGTGILPDGAIGILGNRIEVVGPSKEVRRQYRAHREIDAHGKLVMPGFVDVHTHSADTIVKGCFQDIPGENWMFDVCLALLSHPTLQDSYDGAAIAIAQAVKAGTTTIGDIYCPMLKLVENHIRIGNRAVVASMINEMPVDTTELDENGDYFDPAIGNAKLKDNIELFEQYHDSHDGRIQCRFAPHAADLLSVELLREIKNTGDKYGASYFTHLSQSANEDREVLARTGMRPTELLQKLGYLNDKLMVAHMTYATDEEIRLVAQSGCAFAACYSSNAAVGAELPRAMEFLKHSNKVGLGTDATSYTMFSEMKTFGGFSNFVAGDPTYMQAWKVLRMATIEGARALGMDDRIGSLEKGKLADVIIIDLENLTMAPTYTSPVRNIVPNLVYTETGNDVETVIVNGRVIVDDHKLLTVDEKELVAKANAAAQRVQSKLSASEKVSKMVLARLTAENLY